MILQFLIQHEVWTAIVAYWLYSAAVGSMPVPNGSGAGYKWLYQFLHTLAGNLSTAFGSKIPGLNGNGPKAALVLAALLLFGPLSACSRYVVHPGAYNQFDSATADVLFQTKTFLDNSKPLVNAKNKELWSAAANAYDIAYKAYFAYRDALSTNTNAGVKQQLLVNDLAAMTQTIAAFKKAAGVE